MEKVQEAHIRGQLHILFLHLSIKPLTSLHMTSCKLAEYERQRWDFFPFFPETNAAPPFCPLHVFCSLSAGIGPAVNNRASVHILY